MRRASTFIMLPAIVSCAAIESPPVRLYDGPPKSRGEVAVIREDFTTRTRVESINGESVVGREWELLPGEHSLLGSTLLSTRTQGSGTSSRIFMRADCEIRFDAEAGHEYLVTRAGEVERKRSDFYKFELAAFVVDLSDPSEPVGSYDCEIVNGG